MSRETTIWLAIFAVGAINYVARLSFIALFARRDMPPLLDRALKHVPAAMLTAIVVPAVVFVAPGVLRLDLWLAQYALR
jgi:branched-subunit amino acid transport protein